MSAIEIRIDRLRLRNLTAAQRDEFLRALERQLAALAAEGPPGLVAGRRERAAPALGADALARQVAGEIWRRAGSARDDD